MQLTFTDIRQQKRFNCQNPRGGGEVPFGGEVSGEVETVVNVTLPRIDPREKLGTHCED
jgi:hypothetical protein